MLGTVTPSAEMRSATDGLPGSEQCRYWPAIGTSGLQFQPAALARSMSVAAGLPNVVAASAIAAMTGATRTESLSAVMSLLLHSLSLFCRRRDRAGATAN